MSLLSESLFIVPYLDRTPPMSTITEALDQYEAAFTFARQLTLPEEDRPTYTAARWDGGYRWFRSPNVVCLEKYRHLKTAPTAQPADIGT
jgi:hypothetical protein